ncbi:MAG: sulfatase/phosphatase domain-containing protein, partial [Verrucomicrobiota bacterium]
YYFSHFDTPAHTGIRTRNMKLIHFDNLDHWELYDLRKDSSEMNNLVAHPEYRERFIALKEQLAQLQHDVGDDPNDLGDQPWTGNSQLDAMAANMEKKQRQKREALRTVREIP